MANEACARAGGSVGRPPRAILRRHYRRMTLAAAGILAGLAAVSWSAALAWLSNFCLGGGIAVLASGRPPWLPPGYFKLRRIERRAWRRGRAVLGSFARLPFVRSSPAFAFPGRHALDRLEQACLGAEATHLVAFLIVSLGALLLATIDPAAAAWTMFFNIASNGFSVILQRRTRVRLERLRDRWSTPHDGVAGRSEVISGKALPRTAERVRLGLYPARSPSQSPAQEAATSSSCRNGARHMRRRDRPHHGTEGRYDRNSP